MGKGLDLEDVRGKYRSDDNTEFVVVTYEKGNNDAYKVQGYITVHNNWYFL